MTETLNKLGMPNSRIAFHLEPMKDISPDGASGIELYFSANTGEAMQPLAKIASGGEVSRIALALKTTGTGQTSDKTMIFDEIDVGISGQTGLQVADHIRKLSGRGQIFCITHLPQTAAIADHHSSSIRKKPMAGRSLRYAAFQTANTSLKSPACLPATIRLKPVLKRHGRSCNR